MSAQARPWTLLQVLAASVLSAMLAATSPGCGKSQPVTAESSGLEPADDADSPTADAGKGATSPGPATDSVADDSSPKKPPVQPPTDPGVLADSYQVPDGTPEELAAYLEGLEPKVAASRTQIESQGFGRPMTDEQVAEIRALSTARITAADRILAAKAKEDSRLTAVKAKFGSLSTLTRIGVPGAKQELVDLAGSLSGDENTEISQIAGLLLFGVQVERLLTGEAASSQPMMDRLKSLLENVELDQRVFQTILQTVTPLQRTEHVGTMLEVMQRVGTKFQESENKDLAAEAGDLAAHAAFQRSLYAVMQDEPDSVPKLIGKIKPLLAAQPPTLDAVTRAADAAAMLAYKGHKAEAGEIYPLLIDGVSRLLSSKQVDLDVIVGAADVARMLDEKGLEQQMGQVCSRLGKGLGRLLAAKDPDLQALSQLPSVTQLLQSHGLQSQAAELYTLALDALRPLLSADSPDGGTVQTASEVAQYLEFSGQIEPASQIYALIAAAAGKIKDPQVAEAMLQTVKFAQRRVALVGKPFTLDGVLADGAPLDWGRYKGKIVLVDFWASWCRPCMAEMPNIKRNYEQFRAKGFEVVGVNLDDHRADVVKALPELDLPWTILFSPDENAEGFDNPNAVRCGVDAIPFVVLVGRDGNAVAIHVRGGQLEKKLTELLGPPDAAPADGAADGELPPPVDRGDQPDSGPTSVPPEAGRAPGSPQGAATPRPARRMVSGLVAVGESAAWLTVGPRKAREDVAASDVKSAEEEEATAPEKNAADDDLDRINPYSPDPALSPAELVDFIFDMQEKPKSVQARPGFSEALVEAANRILAAKASDKHQVVAAETKFGVLHKKASLGDEEADRKLIEFVRQMKDDPREKIAAWVRLLLLERRVIEADGLPLEKIPGLLDEVKKYLSEEKLTERHLRIASNTVRAVNRLEDGDRREELFAEFGRLFAGSKAPDLSRYGKKLAKSSAGGKSDLVGKPLEISGTTALDAPFDWAGYRGKVVVVNFWTTGCVFCRREAPHLKSLFEKDSGRGLDVVGVNLDKDPAAVAKHLEEHDVPWTTLFGKEVQDLAKKLGIRGVPTMILVDKGGKVVAVSNRVAKLEPQIEKLLGA